MFFFLVDDTASFDPDGGEWTWRDLATEVETASDLPAAMRHALEHLDERAEQRAGYASLLFGDLAGGGASQRIADRVTALASPDPPPGCRNDFDGSGVGARRCTDADAGGRARDPNGRGHRGRAG